MPGMPRLESSPARCPCGCGCGWAGGLRLCGERAFANADRGIALPDRLRGGAGQDPSGRRWESVAGRGRIARVSSTPAEVKRLRDLARLRRVRDRIDREYAQPLDVEALARGVSMSAGHLSRQFRLAYGESPYSYLMTRRIERAMALLRRGDLSVTDVCFAIGCSSLGTFSTRFTELVGVPPGAYRRRLRAGASAGLPACVARQTTRPIRSREGQASQVRPGLRTPIMYIMLSNLFAPLCTAPTDARGLPDVSRSADACQRQRLTDIRSLRSIRRHDADWVSRKQKSRM